MTENFFPGFEEHRAAAEGQAEHRYAERVLRKLLGVYYEPKDLQQLFLRAGPKDFGFDWFNREYNNCPVRLFASKKAVISPLVLLSGKSITKTPLWEIYFSLKAEYKMEDHIGLIFQLPKCGGQWILHNHMSMPEEPGHTIVKRLAASEGRAIIALPLEAFALSLRRMWTP